MTKNELVHEYAETIRPLLPLAKRAYGSRTQNTPAHEASREYTQLLKEYAEKGGSLLKLASELGVAYSGMRRRIFTADMTLPSNSSTKRKLTQEEIDEAVQRVVVAKIIGTREYHAQLSHEYYQTGVSLGVLAKGLGITNAGPLYYGINRHSLRQAAVLS